MSGTVLTGPAALRTLTAASTIALLDSARQVRVLGDRMRMNG